jgi:hypothetical protein
MLFPFISLASPNVPWCDDQRVLEEWVCLHWTWAKAMDMTVIAVRTELVAYYARRGYLATGERRPFPGYADPERFGHPKRPDLDFVVLRKPLR